MNVPRRAQFDKRSKAEKAIYDAIRAVEALPGVEDANLIEAANLLEAARSKVGDYEDARIARNAAG